MQKGTLFDHLIGAGRQPGWDFNSNRLLRRLFYTAIAFVETSGSDIAATDRKRSPPILRGVASAPWLAELLGVAAVPFGMASECECYSWRVDLT